MALVFGFAIEYCGYIIHVYFVNKSSIVTSLWTMPECIPRSTPNVVIIVVTRLFLVLVAALKIAILFRSFCS